MSETWTFVCAAGELLPGELKTVFDEVTGTPIVVLNHDGELYALEDKCSMRTLNCPPATSIRRTPASNASCTGRVSTSAMAVPCARRPTRR